MPQVKEISVVWEGQVDHRTVRIVRDRRQHYYHKDDWTSYYVLEMQTGADALGNIVFTPIEATGEVRRALEALMRGVLGLTPTDYGHILCTHDASYRG